MNARRLIRESRSAAYRDGLAKGLVDAVAPAVLGHVTAGWMESSLAGRCHVCERKRDPRTRVLVLVLPMHQLRLCSDCIPAVRVALETDASVGTIRYRARKGKGGRR